MSVLKTCALITSLMELIIILYVFVSIIFTLFFSHVFTPDSLMLGTMVPISKNKNNLYTVFLNYRTIALSGIFNKIIDRDILLKEHNSLSCSPIQFEFKNGIFIIQFSHSWLEMIDYYNYQQSFFLLLLDDNNKVRYCKHYNKLFKGFTVKSFKIHK